MSFRLTIILLVVLVALGGAVFFSDQTSPTPTPAFAGSTIILSFLSSDATALEATSKDKSVLVVKDATEGWLLGKPEAARADQVRVESTVSRLASLTATRTIASPGDLGEFGLAEPSLAAKVTLKSGETKTLLLGDQSPDRSAYYVKLPDRDAVYLVASSVGADLIQFVASPPKATPTPTVGPEAGGTPTPAPSTSAAPATKPSPVAPPTLTPVLPAPPTTGTPGADVLPPQAPVGTPVIPDNPLPPGLLTPTPKP